MWGIHKCFAYFHYCQLKEVLSFLVHNSKLGTVIHDPVALALYRWFESFARDLILLCGTTDSSQRSWFDSVSISNVHPNLLPTDHQRRKEKALARLLHHLEWNSIISSHVKSTSSWLYLHCFMATIWISCCLLKYF